MNPIRPQFPRRPASFRHALTLAVFAAVAGCGSSKPTNTSATPPSVGIVTLKAQSVPLTTELPGRTVAYRTAQVRPQVSGILRKRLFSEGSAVKAGQPLYEIDPAPYRATFDSAKASLENAQAALKLDTLKAERYKPLADANAVSKLDLANAVAAQQQSQAAVNAAKAALESARINLQYTTVRAPISGRSGRSSLTEGALVTGDQATALTTVQQIDPLYVDATQPSNVLLRLEREYADGRLKKAGDERARVQLILDDGTVYPEAGTLQFSEVTVDPTTGAVTLRAVFPNPQHLLLPGMFVHLRIQEGVSENALLVPQRGLTHDSAGHATVMTVGADDKVEQRMVTTQRAVGDDWLVTKGLAPGDRVIVRGLQYVKPGITVKPVDDATPAPASSAAGGDDADG